MKKQIEISEDEFELMNTNSLILENLEDVLESAVRDGEFCHVSVSEKELTELIEFVDADAEGSDDRYITRQLTAFSKYLKTL